MPAPNLLDLSLRRLLDEVGSAAPAPFSGAAAAAVVAVAAPADGLGLARPEAETAREAPGEVEATADAPL